MTGNLFIISAPSGAGKSTLTAKLLEHDKDVHLSVSYTTRAPRPGEVGGRDYHFVDKAVFMEMLAHGEFLESAEVHGNHYGTAEAWIRTERAAGHDILLEIDWQGAQQIRKNAPHCCSIFIMPPSVTELERRLRNRATDSEEVIQRRLSQALDDMSHWHEFDYVVINRDQRQASDELNAIIQGRGDHLSVRSADRAAEAKAIISH